MSKHAGKNQWKCEQEHLAKILIEIAIIIAGITGDSYYTDRDKTRRGNDQSKYSLNFRRKFVLHEPRCFVPSPRWIRLTVFSISHFVSDNLAFGCDLAALPQASEMCPHKTAEICKDRAVQVLTGVVRVRGSKIERIWAGFVGKTWRKSWNSFASKTLRYHELKRRPVRIAAL
jgi:hypothetical protein